MNKTVEITIAKGGADAALAEVERLEKSLEKINEVCKRLAEIGMEKASVRFGSAFYDGLNDVTVSTEAIENGYKIVANGKAVAYIEFGAGVYYNGSGSYPDPPGKPSGVSAIGTYGKGQGKKQGWTYKGTPGPGATEVTRKDGTPTGRYYTHGNPAEKPMFYASQEIKDRVDTIIKEVFS